MQPAGNRSVQGRLLTALVAVRADKSGSTVEAVQLMRVIRIGGTAYVWQSCWFVDCLGVSHSVVRSADPNQLRIRMPTWMSDDGYREGHCEGTQCAQPNVRKGWNAAITLSIERTR